MTSSPLQQKIGLYGGSFDPIHRQHVHIAESAFKALNLDEIWLIPTGNAWYKPSQLTPGEHRLAMTEIAFQQSSAKVRVLPIEIQRSGPSYSIDTVQELQRQYPNHTWFFILGADQLQQLETWKDWQQLCEQVQFAVVDRANQTTSVPLKVQQYLTQLGSKLVSIAIHPSAAASSSIRQALKYHRTVCPTDLDPFVYDYILQHQLFTEH